MLKRLRHRYLRFAVCVMYTLAMALMINGHQAPVAASSAAVSDIDLSGYALPDGSLPVLCLDASGSLKSDDLVLVYGFCEACRLTAVPGLPTCAANALLKRYPQRETSYPRETEDAVRSNHFAFSRARSPPAQSQSKTPA
ncbi:hypothetical protein [Pelagibius sp. Alg239-R121]|uniref:hypothetical protein n=1 Tax=Pelagibius sp. Alg239-R121 TaxID=2993448 RepID=UPI0024A7671B|nr:hypothetical protein [Pelagibius sp. Alg239-R121]